MAILKNAFTVTYILILLFFVSSCAPKVLSFKAVPRNICVGQETTVSWKVQGLGLLTADPSTNNTGPIAKEGSIIFTPLVDTNFSIIALRNGKETPPNHQYVHVLNDGEEIPPIGGTAKPVGNKLVATIEHQFQEWGELKIKNLINPYDRSLWVVYEEKEIEIPAEPENCDDISNKPDYCQEFMITAIHKIFMGLNRNEINDANLQPSILQTSGYAVCKNNRE
ncbi:MAG: hypothetical protein WBD99_06410 [Thermodesulfobacteriota bacterium]